MADSECMVILLGTENTPRLYHLHVSAGSVFILAGGKSSRMQVDKAFLELGGRTLLVRTIELARMVAENVTIIGDPAKFAAFAPVVPDIYSDCGPLAGIHAALLQSQTDLNLMLAVDLPFLNPRVLNYLLLRDASP
jgi:molybdopterin-guanine dinucleotide biosynthesis protein A